MTFLLYIGVFAQGSKAKTYLLPIRAELSIVAWILSLGHMAVYLMSYVPQLSHGVEHMNGVVLGSLAVALVLFAPVSVAFGLVTLSPQLYLTGLGLSLIPLVVMELSKAFGLIKHQK
mgnify:CR=1 FL=1